MLYVTRIMEFPNTLLNCMIKKKKIAMCIDIYEKRKKIGKIKLASFSIR